MKIIVTTTPRELMDKGCWIEACTLTGINEWAVKEGLMDSSDEITLTQEQAEKLGFLGSKRYLDEKLHDAMEGEWR